MEFHWNGLCGSVALAFVLLAAPAAALAQTDEIQVYDGAIAEQGVFNLMIHTNFTPIGRKTADYPGAIIPNHSLDGTAEWAYGVNSWFEQGLYMPVWTPYSQGRGGPINGFKLRELFVRPNAKDHTFFYGVNFEFSVNYHYWESRRITSEIRPIVGLHLHAFDIVYNPIVDTDYRDGVGGPEFVPATRVAYNLNDKWAFAAEEYADFGTLRHFVSGNSQFHEVWATVDHAGKFVDIETGVGYGLTAASDRLTFKFMVARDLNSKKH